jgi:hypothetical protein
MGASNAKSSKDSPPMTETVEGGFGNTKKIHVPKAPKKGDDDHTPHDDGDKKDEKPANGDLKSEKKSTKSEKKSNSSEDDE